MSLPPKILLTGATGAIGTEFLKQMKEANRLGEVAVLVRQSKRNKKKLRKFFGLRKVYHGDLHDNAVLNEAVKGTSLVIHLAAIIPTVESKNEDLLMRVNVEGTKNLVEAMEAHAPESMLLFSSSVAIYGDRIKNPNIKIGDPLLGADYDLYSRTKVAAEKIIQNSRINWSIYRMSAIMGVGNHKMSGIMFYVPLETPMEITTVRDTARALVNTIDHTEKVNHQIFNLGGGEACRITYKEFMTRAFEAFGLGKVDFPEYAFAKQNFHCGYYMDGDILEDMLHFRSDTIDSYFERFRAAVPTLQRWITRPFAGVLKWYLTRLSDPLKAYKNGNKEEIDYYFGEIKND
ncbi:MAG: NAD(P)-dependent oxidoreductase [bacterium]|nr:NAD(P)-dependent oxidoreductase [bacterium]